MCSWTFRLVKFDCITNTNTNKSTCTAYTTGWIISICALSMQKERNTFCMHTCLHLHHMKEIATDNERHEQNKRAQTHVTIIIVVFKVFSRVIYSKSVWPLMQSAHMETSLKGFACNKSIWMWVLVARNLVQLYLVSALRAPCHILLLNVFDLVTFHSRYWMQLMQIFPFRKLRIAYYNFMHY